MDTRDYVVFIITTIVLLGFAWFVLAVLFHSPVPPRPRKDGDRWYDTRPPTLRDMQIHTVRVNERHRAAQPDTEEILGLLTTDKIKAKTIDFSRIYTGKDFSSPSRDDKVGATE